MSEEKKTAGFNNSAKNVIAGPFGLALAIAFSVAAVYSLIDMFIGGINVFGIIVGLVILLFYVLPAVGLWKAWASAKKGDDNFKSNMGLIKSSAKFYQVISILLTVLVTILAVMTVALASTLKKYLGDAINGTSEILKDLPADVKQVLDIILKWMNEKYALLIVICILAVVACIFLVINFSRTHKLYKAMLNDQEPVSVMYTAILNFVAIAIYVAGMIILKSFSVAGAINVILLGLTGVLFIFFNLEAKK